MGFTLSPISNRFSSLLIVPSFSLSRELSYEKIISIDCLARKYGIRLASIMGHVGEITDQKITLCLQQALSKLGLSKNNNYWLQEEANRESPPP